MFWYHSGQNGAGKLSLVRINPLIDCIIAFCCSKTLAVFLFLTFSIVTFVRSIWLDVLEGRQLGSLHTDNKTADLCQTLYPDTGQSINGSGEDCPHPPRTTVGYHGAQRKDREVTSLTKESNWVIGKSCCCLGVKILTAPFPGAVWPPKSEESHWNINILHTREKQFCIIICRDLYEQALHWRQQNTVENPSRGDRTAASWSPIHILRTKAMAAHFSLVFRGECGTAGRKAFLHSESCRWVSASFWHMLMYPWTSQAQDLHIG